MSVKIQMFIFYTCMLLTVTFQVLYLEYILYTLQKKEYLNDQPHT